MGCANTKLEHESHAEELDLKSSKGPNKSETTRARRLSYSTGANAVQQQFLEMQKQQQPQQQSDGTTLVVKASETSDEKKGPPLQKSTTRGRRLSYVTKDKDLAARIMTDFEGMGLEDSDGTGPMAHVGATPIGSRPVDVQVACLSRAGREPGYKKTNQDNCFAFEKYLGDDKSLFAAMDGHGPNGHLVSGYVKQNLPILLASHLTSNKPVQEALTKGFLEVDKGLGSSSRIDCEFSGSTCSVAFLTGKTLTTGWVGDSRIVLGRKAAKGDWEAVDMSVDHKPTQPEEKTRISLSHGRVERLQDEMGNPIGPYRVWLQYAWIPGLAMSRALGDQLAHTIGVSSEPQHKQHELTPADKLLILASDGVWEFISSQEAVELVGNSKTPEEGCRALVDEAFRRWLSEEDGVVDDITAVVVRFVHNEL